jgi:ABC-type transport system substrate-binding protein
MNAVLRLLLAAVLLGGAAVAHAEPKVLRYAFPVAETGFDPAQVSDLYSRTVLAHVFEAPYRYDYLARPFKIMPNTADGMPEVSRDFRTWTIHLKQGIYFADDPAFKGKPRELQAQDYVYTMKRFFDPAMKSPSYSSMNEEGILGLNELREQAMKTNKPFDYDREVEGVRALDRYTLQFRLKEPRPRFLYTLADSSNYGAVAREVIDAYPGASMEHPVGTGPFRLAAWRRSSQMVFERNANYREVTYEAEPNADDADGQALLRQFKGRRLPMIDRVEISIVEESQPRWLAFLNGQFDLLAVPLEFVNIAVPKGKLAPNLAKRGMRVSQVLNADIVYCFFNMEDPVIGGYTPEKVALRRAIGLGIDTQRLIRLVYRGQAVPAQSIVAPNTYGYDAQLKSESSDFDLARAKALLDLYGYVDRDGDGWREMPDGRPLTIEYATQPSQTDRQINEMWKKSMDALGVRLVIRTAQWPEQLKKARAGQLMIWLLGGSATNPDVQDAFQVLYGPAAGGQNLARFKLAAFDRLYERIQELPDGDERLKLIAQANKLLLAYEPQKFALHRVATDLAQPWLTGFRRPPFSRQFWQYVDVDLGKRPPTH